LKPSKSFDGDWWILVGHPSSQTGSNAVWMMISSSFKKLRVDDINLPESPRYRQSLGTTNIPILLAMLKA